MATPLPPNPVTGQEFTGPYGCIYVFDGFKWGPASQTAAATQYLPLTGGTMLGEIQLVVAQDVSGPVY
jgi:hypothetical protein